LDSLGGSRTESDLATQFLEAEEAILCQSEAEEGIQRLLQEERTYHGKKMYELSYDIESRYRSDDPAWGDEVLLRKGELYAYFPDGARGSYFYCFEIRVTRRPGFGEEAGALRLIDRVLESFQRETPSGPPVPANLQSR
jgi:hypothetical protein